ncbi:unnamed protein product [Amaranthus hypochondriacus]
MRQRRKDLDIETVGKGESSKLGLKLTKTPSLMNLFSKSSSSSSNTNTSNDGFGSPEKLKAVNFHALSLQIGSWMRESRHEGDLVAKCYFKKRQLVWEVLNGNLKNKIEFSWSNISAIKATFHTNGPGVLHILLEKPPLFYQEVNPQPRKHTNWEQSGDFTNQQASLIRKHRITFGAGVLEKHYNKIIQADSKLHHLSQQPFPDQASIYFPEIHFSNQFSFQNLAPTHFPGHGMSYSENYFPTSGNEAINEDVSTVNYDYQEYYVDNDQSYSNVTSVPIPMSTNVGFETTTLGYEYDYIQQQMAAMTSIGLPSHQLSYDYQNDQHNYDLGGNQWL